MSSLTNTAINGYATASESTIRDRSNTSLRNIKHKIHDATNRRLTTNNSKKATAGWCCLKVARSPEISHNPCKASTKFAFPKTTEHTNITLKLHQKQHELSPPHSTNILLSPTTPKSLTRKKTDVLSSRGYIKKHKIAATLQGEVFVAASIRNSLLISGFIRNITQDINGVHQVICNICGVYFNQETDDKLVIKTADKLLHGQSIAILENGTRLKVKENIIKEARLMSLFMSHNPPQTLIKYYDFFEDGEYYYLVMEKGGQCLFDFTVKCHKLIKAQKLSVQEWRKSVRFILAQMAGFIGWMHNVMNCCNLDISLENVVLDENAHFDEISGTLKNLDIKFIDFGLTELFKKNFRCDKFVGKTGYKSPQVYKKETFLANKADVWSLGVCLFMMSVGSPPYRRPLVSESDKTFEFVKSGKIIELLQNWNSLHYVGKKQCDLMMKMLCFNERDRLSIFEVMNHIWMKPYFKCIPRPAATPLIESNTFECRNNNYCVIDNNY